MSRTTGKTLTARRRRQALRRSQVKITHRGVKVKRAVSRRGRTHEMEAPAPTQPRGRQDILLRSTAIKKFKFTQYKKYKNDHNHGTLRIWFVEGGVYDYSNVPESVVITLAQAQSKGRYFYYNIRTNYNFIRVK